MILVGGSEIFGINSGGQSINKIYLGSNLIYPSSDISLPIITSISDNVLIEIDDSSSLQVVATGSSLTYQWKKNGTAISGETSDTLSFASAQLTDNGRYTVTVTNPGGSVTSDEIIFIVSEQVLTSLSEIANLEFDFDFATATDSSGKVVSITDSENGIVDSQGNSSLAPAYFSSGGLNDLPFAKFVGAKLLTGPVLMPSATEVTIFIIRKIFEAQGSFVGYWGNGSGDGYAFLDGSNSNRVAALLPNQTTIDCEDKSVPGGWEMRVATFATTAPKVVNYSVLGNLINESASSEFVTPTTSNTIGAHPNTNSTLNQGIQRVFGMSSRATLSQIRSISNYFWMNFNLPLPANIVTEGDSITASNGYPELLWQNLLTAGHYVYVRNLAVAGSTSGPWGSPSNNVIDRLPAVLNSYDPRVVNIFTLMIGHNNLGDAELWWDDIVYICNTVKSVGYKVIIQTTLNSTVEISNPLAAANLLEVNTRTRNQWSTTLTADALVDSNAIPAMVDPEDTDYYYDGVHITALGAAEIEAVLRPAVEDLL